LVLPVKTQVLGSTEGLLRRRIGQVTNAADQTKQGVEKLGRREKGGPSMKRKKDGLNPQNRARKNQEPGAVHKERMGTGGKTKNQKGNSKSRGKLEPRKSVGRIKHICWPARRERKEGIQPGRIGSCVSWGINVWKEDNRLGKDREETKKKKRSPRASNEKGGGEFSAHGETKMASEQPGPVTKKFLHRGRSRGVIKRRKKKLMGNGTE